MWRFAVVWSQLVFQMGRKSSKHKTTLLTSQNSQNRYSLRPIVSLIGSPCYALSDFFHRILSTLAGKSDSFVKNSGHFVQLLKTVNLHSQDTLVIFDVVSLFTNVPVDKVLQIIENKLHDDVTLEVEAIMELLEVCLRTTYFQVNDKFFQQKDGMAMGNSLSPIVSNIFMEHFEKLALDSAPYKPSLKKKIKVQ
jgi:hypothetical protein